MQNSLFDLPETIILLDTEYTAWEGSLERKWSGENEYREIVQIAAIQIDTKTLEEISSISLFVKPKINPQLSEYFIKLTGITQEQIDTQGVAFPEALDTYAKWAGDLDTYSFGGDEEELMENCRLCNIQFSLTNNFYDARTIFWAHGIPAENFNSGNIVEAFGEQKTRWQHEALNDVRTILDGLRLLSGGSPKQRAQQT